MWVMQKHILRSFFLTFIQDSIKVVSQDLLKKKHKKNLEALFFFLFF